MAVYTIENVIVDSRFSQIQIKFKEYPTAVFIKPHALIGLKLNGVIERARVRMWLKTP